MGLDAKELAKIVLDADENSYIHYESDGRIEFVTDSIDTFDITDSGVWIENNIPLFVNNNLTVAGVMSIGVYTVATLPAGSAVGSMAVVTDGPTSSLYMNVSGVWQSIG